MTSNSDSHEVKATNVCVELQMLCHSPSSWTRLPRMCFSCCMCSLPSLSLVHRQRVVTRSELDFLLDSLVPRIRYFAILTTLRWSFVVGFDMARDVSFALSCKSGRSKLKWLPRAVCVLCMI